MDHAKLLDVLTSLPVSHAILPRAVCFATSRSANHAICSFIDSRGYASEPVRRCLFIDYIINVFSMFKLRPVQIYYRCTRVVFHISFVERLESGVSCSILVSVVMCPAQFLLVFCFVIDLLF